MKGYIFEYAMKWTRQTYGHCVCGAKAEIYPETARREEEEEGMLLDLSCPPFTHNASFMNVSRADLIPLKPSKSNMLHT